MAPHQLHVCLVVVASITSGCFREVVAHDQTKESARQVEVVLREQDVSVEVLEQGTSARPCFVVSVDRDDAERAHRILVQHNLPQGQPECAASSATVSTRTPTVATGAR